MSSQLALTLPQNQMLNDSGEIKKSEYLALAAFNSVSKVAKLEEIVMLTSGIISYICESGEYEVPAPEIVRETSKKVFTTVKSIKERNANYDKPSWALGIEVYVKILSKLSDVKKLLVEEENGEIKLIWAITDDYNRNSFREITKIIIDAENSMRIGKSIPYFYVAKEDLNSEPKYNYEITRD